MAEPGVGVGLCRVGLCRSPALLSVLYGHAERRKNLKKRRCWVRVGHGGC